jgi:hypothetical protein
LKPHISAKNGEPKKNKKCSELLSPRTIITEKIAKIRGCTHKLQFFLGVRPVRGFFRDALLISTFQNTITVASTPSSTSRCTTNSQHQLLVPLAFCDFGLLALAASWCLTRVPFSPRLSRIPASDVSERVILSCLAGNF